ncbi:MAG: hypothetical protein LH660_19770, partial [Phormidesmis sp. CAN_BIN36]|nr:hypothetical protein [Phormidesmis sp. CAN_BIN36]
PQTNPASPAVFLLSCFAGEPVSRTERLTNSLKTDSLYVFQGCLPLPLKLFPVYRWVFAVSKMLNFVTLGCCSDASRVGQRPQPTYHKCLEVFAALSRSTSAPIPPCPKTAGFPGESQ